MQREHATIRELAYQLWKARGCPTGSAEQDWLDAERELSRGGPATLSKSSDTVDDRRNDTFRTSDPPLSRASDAPPAAAESKWTAPGAPGAGSSRRASTARRTPKPDSRK